jgi:hypothetical protein
MVLVYGWPMIGRNQQILLNVPVASQNIYEQQYQMARFLKTYYDGQSVAVNDIGLVNYLADLKLTDLAGLASQDVMHLMRQGKLDGRQIDRITQAANVKVALVFDSWFPSLPSAWARIGQWTIPHNVVCGGDTVSFYAVDPAEAQPLAAHFKAFSPSLPSDVKWGLSAAPVSQ